MLKIVVPGAELYDEGREEFIEVEPIVLELEHSLFSMSKWEASTEKPFLDSKEKTAEEVFEYIQAMSVDPDVPYEVFTRLTQAHIEEINTYINAKMTATWFTEKEEKPRRHEVITTELIYYWMISFNIPMECEHWHLNRLLTLIKIFGIKNQDPKKTKMSRSELMARNRDLNAQRRAQLGTRG